MSTSSTNGWTRCPPGSLRRLAASLTARRQRQLWWARLTWIVGALVVLAASVGGATALELYIFHHRSAPGGACPPYSAPPTPVPDVITPPGDAPPPPQKSGGC